ncbi:MAG: energy transducer TonB [Terriglobales bacterium]
MKPAHLILAALFVVTACAYPCLAADDQPLPSAQHGVDGFVFCPESASDQPVPLYIGYCKKRQVGTLNCGEKVEVLSRQDDMLRISLGEVGPRGQMRANLAPASAISRQADKFVPFDDQSGVPEHSPDCSQMLARENAPDGFVFCSRGQDSAPVYHSACQSHASDSLACGERVGVLGRSGDLLQVTVPPHGFPRYMEASAVSQQTGKFVPFDDASGIENKGVPDCSHPGATFGAGGGISQGTRPERNVTMPRAIFVPDPPYSELARKKKIQGVILLSLTVGVDGNAHDVTVERGLGYGLDENAVETVSRWKFKPALKDGEPIAHRMNVEVNFHLY